MKDKRNRFLKGALICSVVVNLLFIGLFAGHKARHVSRRDSAAAVENLPPEKKALFLNAVEEIRSHNSTVRPVMRKARLEVLEIIKAPDFDGEAYHKKVMEIHAMRGEMRMRASLIIQAVTAQFTREEREAVAAYLKAHRSERRGHRAGQRRSGR